ncbi:MAG: hypothetical protein WCT32_05575 [Patescibacteria group bacterium]|jgi:hypothetical protein
MTQDATQQVIDIAGIKDGIIILKDGGYRIVVSVSTVNFALKSEQEQNSIIFQYQSFLNSLHFPVEIIMRSRRLDLTPYLNKIKGLAGKQENELLRIQTEDYIDFVAKLIDLANIMKKTFFVAIPFQPLTIKSGSFLSNILNRNKEKTVTELRIPEEEFKRNADEARQRAQIVASGLGSIGLHCVQLTTEELIETFYQIYNPEIAGKERFSDADNLSAPIIEHSSEKRGLPKEDKAGDKSETRIDNSAEVIAVQKEKSALRQQEMLKDGERQIGTSPHQPASPAQNQKEPPKQETAGTTEREEKIGQPQTVQAGVPQAGQTEQGSNTTNGSTGTQTSIAYNVQTPSTEQEVQK